jgi:pyruvate ferredoxin oxidoreductase delta subunit
MVDKVTEDPDIKGLALTDGYLKGGKYVANWRVYKPEIDPDKCVSCGLCASYCPEAAITLQDGKPVIDYRFCKGCGICAYECPQKAIEMILEEI